MSQAIARTTSKAYTAAFRSWADFCAQPGVKVDPFTPSEETLCFYVAWASSRPTPLSQPTVQKYLYGIRAVLLSNGVTFPAFHDMPLLERAMKGWKKESYRRSSKPRLPVTVAILEMIKPHLDLDDPAHRTLWAMLTTAVYGLFRSGEISARSVNSKEFLRLRDLLRDSAKRYRVFLDTSKTDIWRLGVHVHIIANGSATCPIAALDAMLEDRDLSKPDTPLFALEGRPVTRQRLLSALKKLLAKAGLDPSKYSGHSLRKGGAQTLLEAGVPESQIQILGRWRSSAFKLYIQLTDDIRARVAKLMGNCKHSKLS